MYLAQTPRLYLRELTPDDADSLYQLNLDPLVLRYTGDEPFASPAQARTFLRGYDQYRRYGFGRWAVLRRADGAFLGWCGLKYTPELDEVDLGFRLFRQHWQQGYASEAARACVDRAFGPLGMAELVGRAMLANTASIRVLTKTGFVYSHALAFGAAPGALYRLRHDAAPPA